MTDEQHLRLADGRTLRIGQQIPAVTHPGSFATWNRFAAVNDEFIPIHMDDDAGRRAGMSAAFGMGNLTAAWLHILVRGWAGANGRLCTFAVRFRRPALSGMLRCEGVVADVRTDGVETIAELALAAVDERGETIATADAAVSFRGVRRVLVPDAGSRPL